jgi:hypothetical protein
MTPLQLRGLLYQRDQSIAEWARSRGYPPGTVQQVVHRWAGTQGVPRGRLTRSILRDLSKDLGVRIPLNIDWRAAEVEAATPTAPPSPPPAGGRRPRRTTP